MWTSKIERKDFSNGQFRVFVKYTDGTNSFEENYNLLNQENLDATIRNRIAQLEAISAFALTVPIGDYTPPAPVKIQLSSYELAIQEVSRLKNLVALGVIKETDTEFVNALTTLKAEYAKV